jgi:uncharacterized protein YjbI with pentapeptide repeats
VNAPGGRSRGSKPVRSLAPSTPDLPDALETTHLLPGRLRGVEIIERRLVGVNAAGVDASDVRLAETHLESPDLSKAVLRRASIRDTVVEAGDWSNVDASESSLTRVAMLGVRLTGAICAGATLDDTTFVGCRLDLSSFRFAHLRRVRFDECRMEEADLSGAQLSNVVFSACGLAGASLAAATFEACEMLGCDLEGIDAPDRLRGVGMPWNDILRNAPAFARAVGVRVVEDD